jgi:hypothetical protein
MHRGRVELLHRSQRFAQVAVEASRLRVDRHAPREQGGGFPGAPLLKGQHPEALKSSEGIRLFDQQLPVQRLGLRHPPMQIKSSGYVDSTVGHHVLFPALAARSNRASCGSPPRGPVPNQTDFSNSTQVNQDRSRAVAGVSMWFRGPFRQ